MSETNNIVKKHIANLEKISKELTLQQVWKDGIWLQNQVNAGRMFNETIYYLNEHQRILEQIYPNQYDFYVKVNYIEYYQRILGNYISSTGRKKRSRYIINFHPVIRFEQLTIENTIKQSLPIKGIFVQLNTDITPRLVDYIHEDGHKDLYGCKYFLDKVSYSIHTMLGARNIVSFNEHQLNYAHSHLSTYYYSILKYDNFCLGIGEITLLFTKLSQQFEEGYFKSALLLLESYLSWESLEGGPYFKIADLFLMGKNQGAKQISNYNAINEGSNIINYRKEQRQASINTFNLDWKIEGNKFTIIDNEKLENYCRLRNRTSDYLNSDRTLYLYYKDETNNYYPLSISYSVPEPTDEYIPFRGEKQHLKIEGVLENTYERQFYIHPQIKQYVKQRLEYQANKNTIRHSILKRLQDKSENAITVHA